MEFERDAEASTRFSAFDSSFSSHIASALKSVGPEAFKEHFQPLSADKQFALFDLYRQMLHQMHLHTKAGFQDVAAGYQLQDKLNTLDHLEEEYAQQRLRVSGVRPTDIARACRVQQKEAEIKFLEELLKKEEEKQRIAEAELKEHHDRLEQADVAYRKIPETLNQVQLACHQWAERQI